MSRQALGVAIALFVHAALLLFGGWLFLPKHGAEKKQDEEIEIIEDTKDEKKETEPEKEKEKEEKPVEAAENQMPDMRELEQLEAQEASQDAGKLDALSLSDLEAMMNPGAGGGSFGAGAGSLASGGVIGGTGTPGASAGEDMDELLSSAALSQQPRPVFQPAPNYPPELAKSKAKGKVNLVVLVDASGAVKTATVKHSTNPAFDRAAIDAVKKWKFEPALRDGQKVASKVSIPIVFSPN
jgi:protein TonB